jgi:hypothetical protein
MQSPSGRSVGSIIRALSFAMASSFGLGSTPAVSVGTSVGFDTSQLTGPLGGVLALAFGLGCAAGYGFCVKTILKMSTSRIEALEKDRVESARKCDEKISALERRQLELEDMLLGRRPVGMFSPLALEAGTPFRDAALLDEADREDEQRAASARRVKRDRASGKGRRDRGG